jgi:hypothetical protein
VMANDVHMATEANAKNTEYTLFFSVSSV